MQAMAAPNEVGKQDLAAYTDAISAARASISMAVVLIFKAAIAKQCTPTMVGADSDTKMVTKQYKDMYYQHLQPIDFGCHAFAVLFGGAIA